MRANWRFYSHPRPGFFEGLARIIDLGNALDDYPRFRSAREADALRAPIRLANGRPGYSRRHW